MRCLIEIVLTILLFTTFTRIDGQRQGDLCVMAGTIQPGVCRHIMRCPVVLDAAFHSIPYQVCASPENRLIVCCPWVPGQEIGLQVRCHTPREGDNCTMVDTGRAGVCTRSANCPTATEAASKGQSPQICAVEGTVQIICCPLVTLAEGDQCLVVETGRAGKCLRISRCPVAVEAALNGITPQICALDGSVPIVCCEGNVEGSNCTMVDTGRTGVCKPFANCHTAKEAAYKGIFPQTCDIESTAQAVCCPPSTIVEGDTCTVMETGRAGVCRPFDNCQSAKEAYYKGIYPQTCNVQGTVPNVCCPLSTVIEGSNCTMVDTGRTGVCKPFANCRTAREASYKGVLPQTCGVEGTVQIICCPLSTVLEGDNCTVVDTGRTGVCKPFANCQSAKEASFKGIFPQTCDVKGTVQNVCCPSSTIVEGSHCTLKHTGIAGVCRSFANCQAAQESASKGILPQRCDLTDNESELVCCTETGCPPLPKGLVTQLPVGSKAADYCIELAEKIHPCQETGSGWTRGDMCPLLAPDSNIVYHRTPMKTAAEAPYYGRLGKGQRQGNSWSGFSASLVSDQWVVCSATVIEIYIGSSYVLFVGLGGTFTPDYTPDRTYMVAKRHIHPLYNSSYSWTYNSIALLQLDTRVTFTARILPACLHTGTPLPDSGFIQTNDRSVKTTMQRLSQEECSRRFITLSYQHPDGVKHDQEICSLSVNTTGGCGGDWNPGALLTLHNGHRVACTHLLVGWTTWYRDSYCTLTNTRVSSFIPWIEGIVWPESSVVN